MHCVKSIFMCSNLCWMIAVLVFLWLFCKFEKIYREECDTIECLMTEFLHVMHASTHALTVNFISIGLSCFIVMNNIKDITRIMLNPTTVIYCYFLKVLDSLMTIIFYGHVGVFEEKLYPWLCSDYIDYEYTRELSVQSYCP